MLCTACASGPFLAGAARGTPARHVADASWLRARSGASTILDPGASVGDSVKLAVEARLHPVVHTDQQPWHAS